MASIQDMLPDDVVVLRDSVQTTLPAASLVPGDLVQISMCQKVSADVKLIDISGDLRFDRSVLTGEVCITTCAQSYLFFVPANAGRRYYRANRSLDAWKIQMTTSSRYVTQRPGPLCPNTTFFSLMCRSSDEEHCSSRDTMRQRIRSRPCLPNRRQHRLVCIFCLSPGPISHGIWMALSGRVAKLSSAASSSMTTLQREILRFVLIIASLATSVAILIVILWAAW